MQREMLAQDHYTLYGPRLQEFRRSKLLVYDSGSVQRFRCCRECRSRSVRSRPGLQFHRAYLVRPGISDNPLLYTMLPVVAWYFRSMIYLHMQNIHVSHIITKVGAKYNRWVQCAGQSHLNFWDVTTSHFTMMSFIKAQPVDAHYKPHQK